MNENTGTQLLQAAATGALDDVKSLLAQGVSIDYQDDLGISPLERAIDSGHTNVVEYLLDKQADVRVINTCGDTLLHSVVLTLRKGNEAMVALLLKQGAPVNVKNDDGETPLLMAANVGSESIVKLLLDSEADPDMSDKWLNTPLHHAARHGDSPIVRLLLERDASIKKITRIVLHLIWQKK